MVGMGLCDGVVFGWFGREMRICGWGVGDVVGWLFMFGI